MVAVLKDELINGAKIGKNVENGFKLFTCLTTILLYLFIYFTDILFLDSFKKCNFFCYEQISYYI